MKRSFWILPLLCGLVMTALTQQSVSPALLGLANAERAFAKLSVEKGIRDSFIASFADDGINFSPHPTNAKEFYGKRPAQPLPLPVTLNWAPIYGDIAQSGELGYTTGPFLLTDNTEAKRPAQHGMYSSIWKKQADGSWKVLIDLGIQLNSAAAPLDAPFQAAPQWKVRSGRQNADKALSDLLGTDRAFFANTKAGAVSEVWLQMLSEDARVHRNGMFPMLGKQAFSVWAKKQTAPISGEPIKAEVAASAEFGYSYGKYEIHSDKPEKGYYVRVWKMDAKGNWRIVFDVTSPLPEEK
jgi:ketosteroid isomerase-like protein